MAEPRGDGARTVYSLLAGVRNLAADDALLEALSDLEAERQVAALDVLLQRRRDRGLLGLVAGFDRFDPGLQDLVLARIDHLYAAARLGITHENLATRLSAINLIRRSGDARLTYLLAEAVCQPCPKTRTTAGEALRGATARHLERLSGADAEQLQRLAEHDGYLARALHRAIEGWDLHFRIEVLSAAMWMAHRLENVLLAKADSPRSSFGRALLEQLSAPDDARLAGFAWRALRSPTLRSKVAKRLAAAKHPDFVRGLINEAWLLADPEIERACPRIRRWAWLEGGDRALLSLSPEQAVPTLRLIAASGLPADAKLSLYEQATASNHDHVRRAALWRIVGTRTESADKLLRSLAQRRRDPISTLARRELDHRKRRRDRLTNQEADAPDGDDVHPFDALWQSYDDLDDAERQRGATDLAQTCPDFAARLRSKLASARAADRGRALGIMRTVGLAGQLDEQVYHLTSDPDPMVRSQAVAALAGLDGPTARRIARRALDDPDPRVQANAIQLLDQWPGDDKHGPLEPKLRSKHQRVRATAVAALLRMQAPEAAEALVEMLSDESAAHRISALWVVERLELASLLQRIEDLAESDADARVRQRARRLLRTLPAPSAPTTAAAWSPQGL